MMDGIIVATSTPDLTFPSVATMVQQALGMTRGFAFDVQAVCAGFVYALANANALIVSGQAKRVLVIGAETFSRIMDWNDRSTCVLFGDGAGALVLEAERARAQRGSRHPVGRSQFRRALSRDALCRWWRVHHRQAGKLRMQGNPLFRQAVEKLARPPKPRWKERADRRGRRLDRAASGQYPHHPGHRQKMGVPMDQVIVTVQDHGNTSAASIPLALSVGRGARPDQTRRSAAVRSDWRRSGLGCGRAALVMARQPICA